MKEELKQQARDLRKQGHSHREISLITKTPRSTVRSWVKNETLDAKAISRLKSLGDKGRLKGDNTRRIQQENLLSEIDKNCGVLVDKKYDVNDCKLFLALLYWGEGDKTSARFGFSNSDPNMVKICLYLLRKSFDINEDRLKVYIHLHNYHNQEEMIDFWSKLTGIPKNHFSIYNKPNTGISKKPGYKGCLSIRYGDSRILKELFIIIKRFENFSNIAGLV